LRRISTHCPKETVLARFAASNLKILPLSSQLQHYKVVRENPPK
jgi:hypothetical protein